MPTFTGTVVACFTRHQPNAAGLRCLVVGFDANWIVAIDVTSADDDSPIQVGRANILIHSPTQSFFYSADELPGMTFRFELTRHPKGWWLERAKRVDGPG